MSPFPKRTSSTNHEVFNLNFGPRLLPCFFLSARPGSVDLVLAGCTTYPSGSIVSSCRLGNLTKSLHWHQLKLRSWCTRYPIVDEVAGTSFIIMPYCGWNIFFNGLQAHVEGDRETYAYWFGPRRQCYLIHSPIASGRVSLFMYTQKIVTHFDKIA